MTFLDTALKALLQDNGSALHFKSNCPVYFRVARKLIRQDGPRPGESDIDLGLKTVAGPSKLAEFRRQGEMSTIYQDPDGHRFMVYAFRQRGTPGFILRHLPSEAPSTKELGIPEVMKTLPRFPRGLVILSGQAGSGRSTSMASLLADLIQQAPYRILTLEDPVEFKAPAGQAMVSQREIGKDTADFEAGLKAARRQDPDIVMLGNVPGPAALEQALTLASSGPLVYMILTAGGTIRVLEQIVESFHPDRREQILVRLATSLRAILSHHLLTPREGESLVPAFELLLPCPEIREKIRNDQLVQIPPLLERTRGCVPLRQSVSQLLHDERIPREEAERLFPAMRKGSGQE
jgi:pilus retraction protein PilT